MVIRKLTPKGDPPALQTIRANQYVTQSQSGLLITNGTIKWGTFPYAFDGIPDVTLMPYTWGGSTQGTTPYTVTLSDVMAGSFKYDCNYAGKWFKWQARYYP